MPVDEAALGFRIRSCQGACRALESAQLPRNASSHAEPPAIALPVGRRTQPPLLLASPAAPDAPPVTRASGRPGPKLRPLPAAPPPRTRRPHSAQAADHAPNPSSPCRRPRLGPARRPRRGARGAARIVGRPSRSHVRSPRRPGHGARPSRSGRYRLNRGPAATPPLNAGRPRQP